jgi:hypothetical protein
MTTPESVATAVERGDVDELVRLVDALCTNREWDRLVELRDRCEQAVERGRQLWPVPAHPQLPLPHGAVRPRPPARGGSVDTPVGRPRAARPAGTGGCARRPRTSTARRGSHR